MKKIFLFVFVTLVLFLALNINAQKFVANPDLVKLTHEVEDEIPAPHPYKAIYKKGKKELVFIASVHGYNKKTFKFITEEFLDSKNFPDILLIEGISKEEGLNPGRAFSSVMRDERSYSYTLAFQKGVPFLGAEPSNEEFITSYGEGIYTVEDLQGIGFLDRLFRQKMSFDMATKNLENSRFYIEEISGKMFTYDEFKSWYYKTNEKEFDMENVEKKESFPFRKGEKEYKSALMRSETGRIRNQYIATIIAENLNKYNKVLVVYGGHHHVELKYALLDLMGEPEITENPSDDTPIYRMGKILIFSEKNATSTNGKVLQDKERDIDIHLIKERNKYILSIYKYGRIFNQDFFIEQKKFKTLKKANKYLSNFE